MKKLTHIIYEENGAFVAQCLNCDVASCGNSYEEALQNIKEAVELYEDEANAPYCNVGAIRVTEQYINA